LLSDPLDFFFWTSWISGLLASQVFLDLRSSWIPGLLGFQGFLLLNFRGFTYKEDFSAFL
jgi:hypothetical protein